MVKKSNRVVSDSKPSFFKIIFAGHTNQHLRIPPAFMKHISYEATDKAVLKRASGGHWNVKLLKNEDGTYLEDGWEEFVRENCLGNSEFVVFRYDGNLCFTVKIFDKSGCERGDEPITRTHQESAFSNGKRKRGRPRKNSVAALHLHQSKTSPTVPDQHLSYCKSKDLGRFKEKDIQRKITTEERDLPMSELDSQLKKFEEKDTQRNSKSKLTDQIDSHMKGNFSRRKHQTKEVRTGVWKTAESFTSKFPYFKICLKDYNVRRVFILPIPKSFSQTHLQRFKLEVVLRSSEGRAWVVNTVPNAGKSHAFSGGWRAFVSDNLLKPGDGCIFELVDKNEMKVHIIRLGESY